VCKYRGPRSERHGPGSEAGRRRHGFSLRRGAHTYRRPRAGLSAIRALDGRIDPDRRVGRERGTGSDRAPSEPRAGRLPGSRASIRFSPLAPSWVVAGRILLDFREGFSPRAAYRLRGLNASRIPGRIEPSGRASPSRAGSLSTARPIVPTASPTESRCRIPPRPEALPSRKPSSATPPPVPAAPPPTRSREFRPIHMLGAHSPPGRPRLSSGSEREHA
jgi:hypothetical protein